MFCSLNGSIARLSFLLLSVISIAACDSVDTAALPPNEAPTASNVSIIDANGGDTVAGDSLIGNYIYADAEGEAEGISIYRWFRNGDVIGSAAKSTYILKPADIGQSITFEVTPVTSIGKVAGAAVSSAPFVVNNPPAVSAVSFSGPALNFIQVGETLTGSYTYADLDGDLEGISTYRWLRNGIAISGATSSTYTLVAEDGAASITFEVTPMALTGTSIGQAVSSSAIAVFNFPPTASAVSITDNNGGNVVLDDILTGSYIYNDVDADGDLEGISTYRWLRNGVAINGATDTTYTLVTADIGQSISFEVTPVAVTGTIIGLPKTSSGITVINSAPTASNVNITDNNGGITIVGDSLTSNYVYGDWEGDLQGTSTFKWLRNGTAIPGATASTYTLVAVDSGQSITFEVTPVAQTGTTTGVAVTSSGITVVNSAPTVSGVSITDTNGDSIVVGDNLSGNYTYNDIDNDLEGTSVFKWFRGGVPILGAINTTYTLVAVDSGQTITFEITPVAQTGTASASAVQSAGITVINSAPTASSVNITDDNGGSAVVGDSLTGNYNYADVDGDLEGISTFRWLRNGTPIPAATALTYTLVVADNDQAITFEVTPVAQTGNLTGNVVISGVVSGTNSAPTANAVSITDTNGGSAVVGDSLTGNYTYADIDGDLEGASTFKWLRSGTAIPGATSTSYTLVAADSGQSITFEVIPIAQTGTASVTAFTSSGITVANSAPDAGSVNIADDNGGSTVVGDNLTGSYSYTDIDNDLEGTSTFRWLRGGTPIPGAIASSYTMIATDSGQSITFEVTPVAQTGIITGSAKTSGSITVANSAPTASNVAITDDNGGSALVGDSLTGSYTYADVDGDPEGTSIFSWLRGGTAIPGAASKTYTLVAADSGQSITFVVIPAAATGITTGSFKISTGITVANSAPTASSVNITDDNGGSVVVGDNLTGSYIYTDVDNDLEGTSTFKWLRGGTTIPGATASTYTLVAADSGQAITFEVTPAAQSGTITGNPATSGGITIANSAPTISTISITDDNGGSAVVGDNLTGNYSFVDIDNDLEGTSTFKWLRGSTPIPGATNLTYTLVAADSGQSITFEVTPVAQSGTLIGSATVSTGITVANSAPTVSSVTITDTNGGIIVVGDSLTGSYSYADADNDAQGTSTFKWLRGVTPVPGATNLTYTLVAADSGQTITFEVTPVAQSGTLIGSATVSTGITVANSAPTAFGVSIIDNNGGSTVVGDNLTGTYSYADVDNDGQGTSIFKWLRGGTPIPGATNITYSLVAADSGTSITFEVTPVALTGTITGSAKTSGSIMVANSAPTASGVNITDDNGGSAVVGDGLTGNYNYADVDGDLEGISTFRWLRNGAPISGATALTYTLVVADNNQSITFEVTPVAQTGTAIGSAVISGVVSGTNSAPTASAVSITDNNGGNALVGDILTGNYTYNDIDGDLEGTSTFKWLRGGAAIPGATAISYTLVTADSGQSITFEVTPVAQTGTASVTAFTSVGITVANSAPIASGVTITDDNAGGAVVGDSLTGSYSYTDVDNDAQGISTFKWLRGGAPIPGATNSTYTLAASDSGQSITFEVTPVAQTGTLTGIAAVSTGITVANSAPTANPVSITDDNGGSVLVGDSLTGNYNYADIDGDAEGISTFRWLRNGTTTVGTSATYTLITADSGQTISFEVTPVAATGVTSGSAVISSGITVANSAPTADPVSITDDNGGSVLVGDSLTGIYNYADVDGDLEGVSTFKWLRGGTPIPGAITSTYTLVTADSGQAITFEVTPVALTGTLTGSVAVSTGITVANSTPTADPVSITDDNGGSVLVGDSLTGNYNYADIDGDVEGVSTFKWLRNGTTTVGTSATYTLVTADSGQAITFEATPVALTGTLTGSPAVSTGITVANSAPSASAVIIVDDNGGSVLVGDSLTGSYNYTDVDGDFEGTSTFKWLRGGTPIPGAITSTYTLVVADSGQAITFEVIPVALTGAATGSTATSSAITVTNSAPTASNVNITDDNGGSILVGDNLTGGYSYADIDSDLEGITTFKWLRGGTAIPGATASIYTLVAADSGQTITLEVTPVALTGTLTGSAAVSTGITVANSAPTANPVSITDDNGGSVLVGDSLTGNYNYADIDDDLEGTSTFRWLRNSVAIGGATSSTYILVTADSGTNITFEITPVAATGIAAGSAVTSSGITIANSAPTASSINITDNNGGSILVGDILTGSYSYADVDNDAQGTSTFKWLRGGTPIPSATNINYTLVTADSGQTITFEVTPVALTGTITGSAAPSTGITVANSVPTATSVNISDDNGGNALVGDNLTGNYTYIDNDGDPEGTSTFEWLRNGTPIPGAIASTYKLVAEDSSASITFSVIPVATTGNTTGNKVISSAIAVLNFAPTASSVSITDNNGGNAVLGDSLTGNYTYADVDGDAEGTSSFRWLRNGAPISLATSTTYTVVVTDIGQTITFEVTPVALTGTITGSPAVSTGITVANSAPTADPVSITDDNGGSVLVGDSLTGSYVYADWEGDLQGSSAFKWLRNGTAIPGATSTNYTLVTADSGQSITFEVTPVAQTGTLTGSVVTSSGITVFNSAPVASAVTITGSAAIDAVLTGNYTFTDVDADAEGASTFKWLRNGIAIPLATAKTYTLVADDSGQPITFEVTPVADVGANPGSAVVSSNSITVANSAPTASAVSITGSAVIGGLLTGNYSYADVDDDAEGTSTFRWLRGGLPISGAINLTYTLVAADSGTNITFEVTPVASAGATPGTAVVSSNSITVANSAPTASSVSITDDNGGSAVVGDNLTGNYSYADIDDDAEGTSTFKWLRSGVAISGATSDTYTLVALDSGTNITFEVTPVASAGATPGSAVVSSNSITVANSAPTASGVSIIDDNGGSVVVGDNLTGNYTYADIDDDTEGTSTFKWLRSGVAISGAASDTYTLVALDSGTTIIFEVTPVATTGIASGSAVTSSGIAVINSAPVANAGPDQTPLVGDTVTLDGSGSSDVDSDALTYAWSFTSVPAGSAVVTGSLSDPTAVGPTFVVDVSGTYVVQLIVNDTTVNSAPVTVSISTDNSAPVANAGPEQTTPLVGDTVTLDGSGSTDVDGDSLTYAWSFTSVPAGSAVVTGSLSDPTAVSPTFVVDASGTYVVQLIVNDTTVNSAPVTVSISTDNSAPVANAGPDQTTPLVGDTVTLDGSGSSDVDGNALTYAWSFTSVPAGSAVVTGSLSDPTAVSPTFVVDASGTYVVQLIVNDTTVNSAPVTVSISTDNSAPVANAGLDQTTPLVGDTVTLDGSGSTDVDGDALTYAWSFTSVPAGSAVVTGSLSDPTAVGPTFVVDVSGTYVVQLIVNDTTVNSAPVTVSISTDNSAPVANAGPEQTTPLVGDTVTLDGSGSTDVDGDSLTYAWSFTSVPAGSAVVTGSLSDPTAVSPTFVVDASGTYVVQLIVNDTTVNSAPVTVNITTSN